MKFLREGLLVQNAINTKGVGSLQLIGKLFCWRRSVWVIVSRTMKIILPPIVKKLPKYLLKSVSTWFFKSVSWMKCAKVWCMTKKHLWLSFSSVVIVIVLLRRFKFSLLHHLVSIFLLKDHPRQSGLHYRPFSPKRSKKRLKSPKKKPQRCMKETRFRHNGIPNVKYNVRIRRASIHLRVKNHKMPTEWKQNHRRNRITRWNM